LEKPEIHWWVILSGAFLVKKWRPDGPYDEESERAWHEAMKHFAAIGRKDKDPLDWMIDKYGKEKGNRLYWADQLYTYIGKSWECRDCAILNTNEYFDKLKENNFYTESCS
jgi:hypothetical protein